MNAPPSHLDRALGCLERFLTPEDVARCREWSAAPAAGPEVRFDLAPGGAPCPRLIVPDGEVVLASRRDPAGEAERQAERWETQVKPDYRGLIVILGFSGPWLLRALLRRLLPGGRLLLLEPAPRRLTALLAAWPDADPLAEFDPAQLLLAVNPAAAALAGVFRDRLEEQLHFNTAVFIPPALLRLDRTGCERLERELDRARRQEATNQNTTAMYAPLWYRNSVDNLPVLAEAVPLDVLRDCMAGRPALVVAAGPSLDAALPHLKRLAAEAVVIGVGAALPCLRRAGLQPHLAVAVDSDPQIAKQFAGAENETWNLVAPLAVDPEVFVRCRGRAFLFTAELLPGFNLWLARLGLLPARLRIGGTVAVSALDLAVFLGCRQIYLAGLDLSFPDDSDATHAAGASFGGMSRQPAGLIEVPGNFGRTVRTTRQFAGYLEILADYLAVRRARDPELEVINLNPAGARLGDAPAFPPEYAREIALSRMDIARPEDILKARFQPERERRAAILDQTRPEVGNEFVTLASAAGSALAVLQTAAGRPLTPAELRQLAQADRTMNGLRLAMPLLDRIFHTLCRQVAVAADPAAAEQANRTLYDRLREIARWSARRFLPPITN